MKITFYRKDSASSLQEVTVVVGLTNTGLLIPYLTVQALYHLVAYNSRPISYSLFKKTYSNFVKDPKNAEFIVNEKLRFSRGGRRKTTLNTEGLRAFAFTHKRLFQFCPTSLTNFMNACRTAFEEMENSPNPIKMLQDQTAPTCNSLLPVNSIYEGLMSGELPDSGTVAFFELQHVLDSTNTFYIMELKDN